MTTHRALSRDMGHSRLRTRDALMLEKSRSQLEAIAQALSMPPEAFDGDLSPGEIGELATLMRLWLAIEDAQARRRALNVVRQEAERSGYRA